MLYNIQVWGRFLKKEIEELEKAQGSTLKRLLKLPTSTSYWGVLWETGVWPVKDQIMYKKMMLLHNIIRSPDERMIRKMIIEQEQHPIRGSWLENLKKDGEQYGIKVDLEQIQGKSKKKFKELVKSKIKERVEKVMKENQTTKMRTVVENGFGRKNYLTRYDPETVKDIMKVKLHMVHVNENFRKEERPCWICRKEKETTEHVMSECKAIEEMIGEEEPEKVDIGSIEDDEVEKMVVRYRLIKTLFEKEENRE